MAKPQTFENHSALDTITHFILAPLFLINFFYAIYLAFHAAPGTLGLHIWWIVISIGLILLNVKTRFYALKGQDRLIRLEERLRLAALVPEKDKAIVAKLTEDQLIGLRFADDEELAALAVRAVEENLTRKQIKAAIEKWRPDHFRV